MEKEIQDKLEKLFQSFFNDDQIILTSETSAKDIDGWDSLTHLELLHQIENKFSIEFQFEEILSFENIDAMINCIENKLK